MAVWSMVLIISLPAWLGEGNFCETEPILEMGLFVRKSRWYSEPLARISLGPDSILRNRANLDQEMGLFVRKTLLGCPRPACIQLCKIVGGRASREDVPGS